MLKIRRSWDHLIFNMGIPILVRRYLYIETGPKYIWKVQYNKCRITHIWFVMYDPCKGLWSILPFQMRHGPVSGCLEVSLQVQKGRHHKGIYLSWQALAGYGHLTLLFNKISKSTCWLLTLFSKFIYWVHTYHTGILRELLKELIAPVRGFWSWFGGVCSLTYCNGNFRVTMVSEPFNVIL